MSHQYIVRDNVPYYILDLPERDDGITLNRVVVVGRAGLARLRAEELIQPAILLSATDPSSDDARFNPELIVRSFSMKFEDEDVPFDGKVMMTEHDAKGVVLFLERHWNDVKTVVCQCEAGLSRSAGMAAAIIARLGGSDHSLYKYKIPNSHVKSMILREFHKERR